MSGTTWGKEFELFDGFYSISDIQGHLEYFMKKRETLTDKPPIQIYVNKIQKRVKFKIKSGYYLELLTAEAMNKKSRKTRMARMCHD